MLLKLKKGRDGPNVFVFERADGSHTIQHQRQAFFAAHDLTHYAVETVLDQRGFYQLLEEGWGVEDFGPPWPRGPVPPEALYVEHLVGLLDVERATGVLMAAADVNSSIAELPAAAAWPVRRDVTDEALHAIRTRRAEVLARWESLAPGATLTLKCPR